MITRAINLKTSLFLLLHITWAASMGQEAAKPTPEPTAAASPQQVQTLKDQDARILQLTKENVILRAERALAELEGKLKGLKSAEAVTGEALALLVNATTAELAEAKAEVEAMKKAGYRPGRRRVVLPAKPCEASSAKPVEIERRKIVPSDPTE